MLNSGSQVSSISQLAKKNYQQNVLIASMSGSQNCTESIKLEVFQM